MFQMFHQNSRARARVFLCSFPACILSSCLLFFLFLMRA
nr:MAG TPA: hypothetical protein [Caudoviricetes sp.]